MIEERNESPYYTWSFPGCPVRVHLHLNAMADLGAKPAAPAEGLLLGEAAGYTAEITRLLPANGRSIADLLAECSDEQVLGYFRISAGEPLALTAGDLALFQACFPRPHHVFLRVQMCESGPANATFFFHDRGRLQGNLPFLEFPFDPSLLTSPGWAEPGNLETPPSAAERPTTAIAAASDRDDTVVPDGAVLNAVPASADGSSAPERRSRWHGWAGALILALVLSSGIAITRFGPPRSADLPNTYTEVLLTIPALVGIAGLVCHKPGIQRAALLGFLLLSWPPFDWLLSLPLEAPYPMRRFRSTPQFQAIVVMSAGVQTAVPDRPFPLPDRITFARCHFAAWLQRTWPQLPVLASGGGEEGAPYSAAMRQLLVGAGVSDSMIWTEDHSRNTYESAVYSAQILRAHGIVRIALVVEARSMFRAAACFRKQGIEVVPAPCGDREWNGYTEELLPSWRSVARNEATLHEIGGILWYRLHGWM